MDAHIDPIPEMKEQLRLEILSVLGKYSQITAAEVLGIDQPRMCDLHHGKLERFSLEKLIRLVSMIDRRVDLRISYVGTQPLRIHRISRR